MKSYASTTAAWLALNGIRRVFCYDYLGVRRLFLADSKTYSRLKKARRILSEG